MTGFSVVDAPPPPKDKQPVVASAPLFFCRENADLASLRANAQTKYELAAAGLRDQARKEQSRLQEEKDLRLGQLGLALAEVRTYQVPSLGRHTTMSWMSSPVMSVLGTGRSPAIPHCIEIALVKLLAEVRTYQVPLLGRHTTMSQRLSPSRSVLGIGMSPAWPHWRENVPFQLLAEVNGREPTVVRNDAATWAELSARRFDNVVLSPGPGHPGRGADFGVCADVLRHATVPVLGVCLGHQGIAVDAGGVVERASIVLGGVGSRPHLARAAGDKLVGRRLDDEDLVREVAQTAAQVAKPLDNTDFVMGWRKEMTRHYVAGALRELATGAAPRV